MHKVQFPEQKNNFKGIPQNQQQRIQNQNPGLGWEGRNTNMVPTMHSVNSIIYHEKKTSFAFLISHVLLFCLYVYMNTTCVPAASKNQF